MKMMMMMMMEPQSIACGGGLATNYTRTKEIVPALHREWLVCDSNLFFRSLLQSESRLSRNNIVAL